MASTSEVGHAKNTANFHDLISFCQGYGEQYNPGNNTLKIVQLQRLENDANARLAAVIPFKTAYDDAINARIQAFDGLRELATKILNALQATGATKEKINDAKTYNKKIQGSRAKPPKTQTAAPVPATISTSQKSYDQTIQHFAGLLSVLQSEASYQPNETDLKLTALSTRLQAMAQANDALSDAYTGVANKRIERDQMLYNPETGLVATAQHVKKYVKSVFGAKSPQYEQISGLQFKIIK